jgi:deoxyribose-phosphate aldolase
MELVIRCMDLTALGGDETSEQMAALCATAVTPNPLDGSWPSVAAVCLYPAFVPQAVAQLEGSGVRVAGVAFGFPSEFGPLDGRLSEIRDVVAMGADEVDIVMNRPLFLAGRSDEALEELAAAREAAGSTCLKVILEAGRLGSFERIRQASMLAMSAGADFIKTSTGKAGPATLPHALCMAEAIRDHAADTGRRVGLKVAGGIRATWAALEYVGMVGETLGSDWLTPERFRIGASSLLDDVLAQVGAS